MPLRFAHIEFVEGFPFQAGALLRVKKSVFVTKVSTES
jgi:hypothetical protein